MKNCRIFSIVMLLNLSSQAWAIPGWNTCVAWLLATQQTEGRGWNRYSIVGHHRTLENSTQTLVLLKDL